jgi:hypothetical protein
VLKGYGKKAQEFAVENMISPADIATLALKVKNMVPAGMLTYSGGLNEGEDAEIARMRENDRPNPPPKHFDLGGWVLNNTAIQDLLKNSINTSDTSAGKSYPLGSSFMADLLSRLPVSSLINNGSTDSQATPVTPTPTSTGPTANWSRPATPQNPADVLVPTYNSDVKTPIVRAEGSPETGETGAAYGNPAMLAAGEKMRARKMLEQFDKKKQTEPVMRDPTEAEALAGPSLSATSGMAPREDRLSLLPRYSKEQGVVAPKWVEDAANAVAAPVHAYRHGNIGPEEAMNVAMNVMGGGMGTSAAAKTPVGPGTLGMFLGKASKTYNPAAEALLLKLEKEGVPPQEIYRITQEKFGHPYGRSPMDQQIKYEISDQGASFKPLANERTVQPDKYGRSSLDAGAPYSRLGEVYHHPELQAAHPDLMKKTFVGLENTPEVSGAAMFDTYNLNTVPTAMDKFVGMISGSRPGLKRGQKIHVSGPDEATRKQVLTHELDHFSQNLNKDWEGGSSLGLARESYPDLMHAGMEERLKPIDFMDFAKDFKKQNPDQAKNMSVANMVEQYQEKHVKPSNNNLAEYRNLHKQGYFGNESSNDLIRKADEHVAHDIYNRISGEAGARLSAARSNLSSKQLGETYPYEPNYFKTATDENLKDILHGPVTRAAGSPPTGERSYEKTARNDYEQFRKNVMENPDSDIEFELRAAPRPSNALAEDMKGTNLQKVPPRTYFYNDADLNKKGWTATEGKNKGAIIVAAKESDDPKKIRSKVNTMGHELHHRRVGEVGEENMPLHPAWPFSGIPPEKQDSIYNPRWKLEEVMNAFVPARTPNAENHPTDISSMHWGRRANRKAQEQIANLAGYEAMQKTGTPISQTAVGKAMLEKDPALLDYFYSQTSAGRPGGGVWDMHSAEYKRAITPSMKEKAAEMFKKWLVSRGINTVNR